MYLAYKTHFFQKPAAENCRDYMQRHTVRAVSASYPAKAKV